MATAERQGPLEGSPLRIVLAGEVDVTQQRQLDQCVTRYRQHDHPDVVVDFSGVRSLGSPGLNMLAALTDLTSRRGGHVQLMGADAHCMTLLRLFGFARDETVDLTDRAPARS